GGVGEGDEGGAYGYMTGWVGCGRDEHFRASDQLEPARVMLADPRLVVIQPVEMLEKLEIPLNRQRRVLVVIMERREKNAAADVLIAHAESSGGTPPTLTLPRLRRREWEGVDRRPSPWSPQANFPHPSVAAII